MKRNSDTITPSQLYEKRTQLVNKYGEKIIKGPSADMTDEEKTASIMYRSMTNVLHKAVPEAANADKMYEFYVKQGVNSSFGLVLKYAVKLFWIVLPITILLAVLKFLFS